MLKKMRKRVILASMTAFTAVILLIASLVNIVDYYVMTHSLDRTLEQIKDFETRAVLFDEPQGNTPPPKPFMDLPNPEANYMTRFFTVNINENGEVIATSLDYIASVDRENAIEYAKKVLKSGKTLGFISDYRYETTTNGNVTTVIFLNAFREIQFMNSLFWLTLGIAGISIILVFVLVYISSSKAIRPFARNIERQKQFITDASHELKTPLTSISTSIDVIEMEHGNDEWTDNVKSQVSRMTKLVGEMVALSKLDETNPLPNKENFSLSETAWEIAEVYKPQAKAHGRELDINISDNVFFFGEKAAVQQMLSVLLDNAIKYSNDNSAIDLTVEKSKSKAHIEVRNSCNYEVPPDVNRLFDRFYRPDSSRNSATGGTGIGLSIAKAVVEAHEGSIKASCPDGKTMVISVTM